MWKLLDNTYLTYSRNHLERICRKFDEMYKNVFFFTEQFCVLFLFPSSQYSFSIWLLNVGKMWESSIWMGCELRPRANLLSVWRQQLRAPAALHPLVLWITGFLNLFIYLFLSERGCSWNLERSEKGSDSSTTNTLIFNLLVPSAGMNLNTAAQAYFVQLCWKSFLFL